MNESGRAVGPARGQYRLDLDQVVVVHDEIDLPFGEVRERKGGGLAGHNGLKSVKDEPRERRLLARAGRRRAAGLHRSGDRLPARAVAVHRAGGRRAALIERAADETERLLEREYAARESRPEGIAPEVFRAAREDPRASRVWWLSAGNAATRGIRKWVTGTSQQDSEAFEGHGRSPPWPSFVAQRSAALVAAAARRWRARRTRRCR